eukprot:Hpha_TRINITY_DN9072_c0_g1::TRINITY_DN9072_c0_g1_i1::g.141922::m.141922
MPYPLEILATWSVAEVQRQLRREGNECGEWADESLLEQLRSHEVDGAALLELTKDDLREDLGIKSLGRIKRILRGIRRLVTQNTPTTPLVQPPSGDDPDPAECDAPISSADLKPDRPPGDVSAQVTPMSTPAPRPPTAPPGGRPQPPRTCAGTADAPTRQQRTGAPSRPAEPRRPSEPPEVLNQVGDLGEDDEAEGSPVGLDGIDIGMDVGMGDGGEAPQPRRANDPDRTDIPPRPATAIGHRPVIGTTATGTPVVGPLPGHAHAWEEDAPVATQCATDAAVSVFRPKATGDSNYSSGILETERRYEALRKLFNLWDESSDISVIGSGAIEFTELCTVLQEFYSWDEVDTKVRVRAVLETIDRNCDGSLNWSEFQEFMTSITQGMPPREFDHLIAHFSVAVTRVAEAQEKQRRLRLLGQLFDEWDDDHSGLIDAEELERVLTKFNAGCAETGDDRELSELKLANMNDDEGLDRSEFVTAFAKLTAAFSAASFDLMYYRLMRVLEDLVFAGRRNSLNRMVTADELSDVVLRSTPLTPLILYGRRADPSKAVERCAQRFGVQLRPFLVTHEKAEQEALRAVARLSMSRGWWIYIVVGQGYRCDTFFREAGVALQTANTWAVHRKFRLWIKLPSRTLGGIPNILYQGAIALGVDNSDAAEVAQSLTAPPWKWRMGAPGHEIRRPASSTGIRGSTGRYA